MQEPKFFIQDYIGVFDKVVEPEDCKELIKYFGEQYKVGKVFAREESANLKKDISMAFSNYDGTFPKAIQNVERRLQDTLKIYLQATNFAEFCDIRELHWLPIKLQKTSPSGGYHMWHIERNYNTWCKRALVFTVYLNTIEKGGETEFLIQKQRCEAQEGRICWFPADFPYVHRGNPPLEEDKYILTSWLVS